MVCIRDATDIAIGGVRPQTGSGQSEYLVVYGGLQLALGLTFLVPLLHPEKARDILMFSILLHAVLVLFRTISLGLFSGINNTTYILAVIEWAILIASLVCLGMTGSK